MQPVNLDRRVLITLIVIAVVSFTGYMIYGAVRRPVSGGFIRIANIREHTRGKPRNRLALAEIEHSLYMKMNEFSTTASNSVRDMRIREGTFEQIERDGWHRASMIVDSESVRMSFRFFYQWGTPEHFEQYGGVIFCVDPEDVIFPEFQCEDMAIIQGGSDPVRNMIADILPVTTPNYTIRANLLSSPIEITITVRMIEADYTAAAEESHYQTARSWLTQQGVDLEQFTVARELTVFPGRD